MARYSIRKPTRDDIPALRNHQQVTGRNTEIGLVMFKQDEWEHIIDTYEHSIVMVDDEKDGYIFGYHLTAQIENNCWIREIFIEQEYRDNPEKRKYLKLEGFGGVENMPLYSVVRKARELGGMAIAPIASDNERAVSAMLNAYGFRHDRTIDRWYDPKDLAIYIEDTGTKPYQNV